MDVLTIERREPALILRLSGELAQSVPPALREQVAQALDDDAFDIVVFDLSAVFSLDSTGIGFLVAQNTRAKGRCKAMYLLQPSQSVRKALELVQLMDFFSVLDDEDDLEALLPL